MSLQPYQKASDEIRRQSESPGKFLKNTALTIGGLGASSQILKQITPFFNKFIPKDIAIKGLTKINPTLGKFIQGSVKQGYPMEDVLEFVKSKVTNDEEENEEVESKAALQSPEMQQPTIKQMLKDPNIPFAGNQAQQPQPMQQEQQMGPGQQALMAAIQKLQQARGG